MAEQLEFAFPPKPTEVADAPGAPDGLAIWRENRSAQMAALARRQGLPLGSLVRVELRDGSILEGRLSLLELFVPQRRDPHLRLSVSQRVFPAEEILSCVRLEEADTA